MMVGSELDMNPRPEDIEETLPREASGLPVALGPGGPILFVAFFCDNPRELPSRHSLARLESVAIGRGRDRTARRDAAQGLLELTLPDAWTSARHAGLVRSGCGPHHRADRTERRRQDHAVRHHHRLRASKLRQDSL